jgi:hypothetical protein
VLEIGGKYYAWSNGGDGYSRKSLTVAKSRKGDNRVLTDSKFIAVETGVSQGDVIVLNPRDVVPEARTLIAEHEEREANSKQASAAAETGEAGSGGQPVGKSAGKGSGQRDGKKRQSGGGEPGAGSRKGSGGGSAAGSSSGLGGFAALDKDKDGKISKAESKGSYLAGFFDRVDTNSDGFITAKEATAARERRKTSGGGE